MQTVEATGNYEFAWPNIGAQPMISTTVTPRHLSDVVERHLERTNILFCDGHVKSLRLDFPVEPTTTFYGGQTAYRNLTSQDD